METRQRQQNHKPAERGFSLLELMITVAIISILAGIAIPLYDGYIREGHMATMRSTMNGLRTVAEDFHLDNGNYGATGSLVGIPAIDGRFNWEPSGDSRPYTYTVVVTGTNAYDVLGTLTANAAIWVRCENRFTRCCDPDSGTAVSSACP